MPNTFIQQHFVGQIVYKHIWGEEQRHFGQTTLAQMRTYTDVDEYIYEGGPIAI